MLSISSIFQIDVKDVTDAVEPCKIPMAYQVVHSPGKIAVAFVRGLWFVTCFVLANILHNVQQLQALNFAVLPLVLSCVYMPLNTSVFVSCRVFEVQVMQLASFGPSVLLLLEI